MNDSRTLRHKVTIAALALAPLFACSGCTHVWYELRHTGREIKECTGLNRWEYYHSSKTGEIVPKLHNDECSTWCEPAFYGHDATCWSYWPEGWIGCPTVIEQHVETIEQAAPPVEVPEPGESPAESQ